ncbi:MAG: HD domain-containing protein [Candidatus Omnitrophica bacterium]|nr:HD domain-containing protein [Candidatus Omnitrophota bacterium]
MKRRKEKISLEKILNFISEAGMLKRVQRSGWSVLGIKGGESVAEHSFRTCAIGYLLAHMEKVPAYKVLLMTLFGDIQEARISDLHKMAQRYINAEVAEDKSFAEQISSLPKAIKAELTDMRKEYKRQRSRESIIARDADILECLIQAKEYREQGFLQADKFMKKAPRFLKTKSARAFWRSAKSTNLNDWWSGLSQFKR